MPPLTTAHGALLAHITGGHLSGETAEGQRSFQPMNINFGLFAPCDAPSKGPNGERLRGKARSQAKKRLQAERALGDWSAWLETGGPRLAAE